MALAAPVDIRYAPVQSIEAQMSKGRRSRGPARKGPMSKEQTG